MALALSDEAKWLRHCQALTRPGVSQDISTTSSNPSSSSEINNEKQLDSDNDYSPYIEQDPEQLLLHEFTTNSSPSSSSTTAAISVSATAAAKYELTVSTMSSEVLSHRFLLIRLLNQEIQSCLDIINLNMSSNKHIANLSSFSVDNNSTSTSMINRIMKTYRISTIADLVSRCRGYIFSWVKDGFISLG